MELLLEALSRNVLSSDVWAISFGAFVSKASNTGIPIEKIDKFTQAVNAARKTEGKKNPMSCMF